MEINMKNELITDLKRLIKSKAPDSNKGTNGTLTVIAGSAYYRGAAFLAVSAAARCGAGIVRLASTEKVVAACAAKLSECTFLPIEENAAGSISAVHFSDKLSGIVSSKAVLVGCGMTDCFDTGEIVSRVIREGKGSLVIDADGLNAIKTGPQILTEAQSFPIITPHVGEMARLSGLAVSEIKKERLKIASDFSKKYRSVVVLKDYVTTVCSPDGGSFVCNNPNPGLAKGGSGDVLAGMIASFAAQGYGQFDAAVCGVVLHSLAAALAAEKMTEYAMLPSDIIRFIPNVFAGLSGRKNKIDSERGAIYEADDSV